MKNLSESIGSNFKLTEQDQVLVRRAGELLKNHMQEFVNNWYEWLSGRDEFEIYFGSNPANLARVKKSTTNLLAKLF